MIRVFRIMIIALCAFGVWAGIAPDVAAQAEEEMANLYSDASAAREMAVSSDVQEYDRTLFAEAEADYEQGATFYEAEDARATVYLSSALQKYNQLLEIASAGSLREVAEREYEHARQSLAQVTEAIGALRDDLRKEGVSPTDSGIKKRRN